jgi:hypothetical protein
MPEVIVSDRDTKFALEFCTLLMKKAKIKLKFNMAFHLEINGQIERVNGILNFYLRNYVVVNHRD